MSIKNAIKPYGEAITTGMPSSILPGMYRTILFDLGVDEVRFDNLLLKYTIRTSEALFKKEKESGKDPSVSKRISSTRSSLRDALMRSSMTWKVLIKGIEALNVKEASFGFQLWYNDDNQGTVSVMKTVRFDDPNLDTNKILSEIFGAIMGEMNVSQDRFLELMALYIQRSKIPQNSGGIASVRAMLQKELFKENISWNVFVKGLLLLDVGRFVFAIQLKHQRGSYTEHKCSVILDQFAEIDTNDE